MVDRSSGAAWAEHGADDYPDCPGYSCSDHSTAMQVETHLCRMPLNAVLTQRVLSAQALDAWAWRMAKVRPCGALDFLREIFDVEASDHRRTTQRNDESNYDFDYDCIPFAPACNPSLTKK